MMMIKSNGGSGSVENVVFQDFIGTLLLFSRNDYHPRNVLINDNSGHGNAYSLNVDSYWSSQSTAAGNGVEYNNITFTNWHGTEANGAQRGPIRVICPDKVPCTGITISDWAMWTESGTSQTYTCRSAYGSGSCLRNSGSGTSSYTSTTTATAAPSGYSAPTMAADLKNSFGTTASIPIPAIPTSFFPGRSPASKLAGS